MRNMRKEEKRELGLRIKTARKKAGLYQAQLADTLDIKVGTLSKYKQGYRTPDIATLLSIAHVLDCSINELIEPEKLEELSEFSDEVALEDVMQAFFSWIDIVNILVSISTYRDDEEKDHVLASVEIDGVEYDVTDSMREFMEISKNNLILLVKQFGKRLNSIRVGEEPKS